MTCKQCGGPLPPQKSRGPKRATCSDRCRTMYSRYKRLGHPTWGTPGHPYPMVAATCAYCGIVFEHGRWKARNYCSRLCAGKAAPRWPNQGECQRCHGPRSVRGLYCSACRVAVEKDMRARDHAAHRIRMYARLERLRAARAAPVNRRALYERDGGRCGICGRKVNLHHPAHHPLSFVVDHIVPLALGGLHTPENVQTAHWGCNNRKSAKIPNSQLRMIG